MIIYGKENGYGNVDTSKVRAELSNSGCNDTLRSMIKDLMYDYECIMRVIDGSCVYRHSDGSETRRLKLYKD